MTYTQKSNTSKLNGPVRNPWKVPGLVILGLLLTLSGVWRWKTVNKETISLASSQSSVQVPLYDPLDKPMTIVLKGVDMASGKFIGNKAVIHQSKTRYNQMKQAVLAYLHGPRDGKFQVPVPNGMELNQLFLTAGSKMNPSVFTRKFYLYGA
jgi:hypothetical protein